MKKVLHSFLLLVLLVIGSFSIIGQKPNRELIQKYILGASVQGIPIYAVEIGKGEEATVIMGVIHGDEPQGKYVIEKLIQDITSSPSTGENGNIMEGKVIFIPVLNPDGLAGKTRVNANGVDINRNFPTRNWTAKYSKKRYFPGTEPASEPETQAILKLFKKYKIEKIVVIHSPKRLINYDGPAKELAEEMAKYNHYPVVSYIGYKTPGSLGTYAGKERKIPTITLELPPGSPEQSYKENKEAILKVVTYRRYGTKELKAKGDR